MVSNTGLTIYIMFIDKGIVLQNVLEVWYHGLPLGIYEGYMLFLDKDITLEYYQVFAHLRRIGYVVLRHQGR